MNWQHLKLTFIKDGLEMLRDRRTLFVNLVLPVLLYPVLTLLAIQILSLTKPGPEDLPRLALVDLPLVIENGLPIHRPAAVSNGSEAAPDDTLPPARFAPIRDPLLADTARQVHDDLVSDQEELRQAAQHRLLEAMRDEDVVILLIGSKAPDDSGHRFRVDMLVDNAHRDALQCRMYLRTANERIQRQLLKQRLAEEGLLSGFAEPMAVVEADLATRSEAARTRLAGFIPVILLLMAISGAFYPALDLIAGERERGTLETLLSWPGDRTAIFTGKLLVVMTAALVSVLLNLLSLGVTAGIIGSQMPAEANVFGEGISIGPVNLLVGLALLIPLALTLATSSLALAGIANSFKEAQNYLSPFMLLVMTPGMLVLMPQVQPSLLLDLVPVLGPLVVLKASLQSGDIPWAHVVVAFGASAAICAAVVHWSVRLLGRETFLYPSLARRGWGRFALHPIDNPQPTGVEALILWCVALGCFFVVSGIAQATMPPLLVIMLPLVAGILGPTLLYSWLGRYRPGQALRLQPVRSSTWALMPLLWFLATCLAMVIGALQLAVVPADDNIEAQSQMREIFIAVHQIGGVPLLVLALAVTPGICEEALFRGPILSGLQRSLGKTSAVIIAAALFAITHMSPARFFPQFAIGLVAGAMTLRCRSVIPAMVLHACFNGGVVIVGSLQFEAEAEAATPAIDADTDLFGQVVSELDLVMPPVAELMRSLGPSGSFAIGLLVMAALAGACALVIRQMQPHHRAVELGSDQAPRN